MYGFLYLDGLCVHTAIVRRITYVCLPLFGCIACSYSNRRINICMRMYCVFIQHIRRTNICMPSFIWMDVLHVHTAIVRRTNICMASFIWMYCMFIQQL